MITYVYETIPSNPGEEPEQFEWRQSIHEPTLESHPETGVPVRRIISGGLGFSSGGKSSSGSCCQGSCGC
ncbi:MAG: zinc ribbon domain-containing protein [Verrucomicrobiota bacterium JB023]|nr:zinc ribbon domain-containing protein [Verrucomicrobiota bacterium JB023]